MRLNCLYNTVTQRIGTIIVEMTVNGAMRTRLTPRLRLEPISAGHAQELWLLHQDKAVAQWHGGPWSTDAARQYATGCGEAWNTNGVSKWTAYDRSTGELVGRGGLSLKNIAEKERLEVGWTVRSNLWGQGYAAEIGRAGIAFGFDELKADEIVAFTERHNTRSRAVMERLGMRYVGEIMDRGLVEGRDGVHDQASFALYALQS